MSKSYFTYVLICPDDTLYCGYTDDLSARLKIHNSGLGAKYTRARLPVELLASVAFDDKKLAMKCEWWFKHKLSRKQKLTLIKENTIKEQFENYQKNRK
ncbi:MAG: GIY-YIG nuclease family protein [Streptococcaceae bacterium]|nr:GIY-YIG nuclease family protein [Streptococcaceae bacterium]